MRTLRNSWAVLLLALVAACASVGAPDPQSFDQKMAYVAGSLTAANQSVTNAIASGTLNKADATKAGELLDQVRFAYDGAKLASDNGDTTTAAGKLQIASTVLLELQRYLLSRGVK